MPYTEERAHLEFAIQLLKANPNWTMASFRDHLIAENPRWSTTHVIDVSLRAWYEVHTGAKSSPIDPNPRTPAPGTPGWYLLNFERITTEMLEITRAKNADYTGANKTDAFHNFRAVEQLGLASVEVGILTRMSDKFARISALLKPGHQQLVKTESIEDTLKDLANYSIILLLYLRLKNIPLPEKPGGVTYVDPKTGRVINESFPDPVRD